MDWTAGASAFPVDLEGSLDPGQLPEITLKDDSSMTAMASFDQGYPPMVSKSYSGRLSPGRGRSIKEYDKQISDLKKENFSLKIRIYHMEERMQQRYGDGQDVYKLNVELQVEVDKLKKELEDKQDLIQRADVAMDTLRANYNQEEEAMRSRILSEFKENIKDLQAELEKAKEECEKYRAESHDARGKVESLQQDLNSMNADWCRSNREKDDLADKLKTAEFDVQHLTAQLKLIEQSKSETEKENKAMSLQLENLKCQLQQSQKEISRSKRDLQSISTLLEDHSHIDSTSILEPVHKQDEMEDALETIKQKEDKLGVLEDSLKQKDNMVGNLEDTLKELEKRLKDVDAEKKKTEMELEQLRNRNAKINKSYQSTIKTLAHKDTELRATTEKLQTALDKIKSLEECHKEVELEKATTITDLTKELSDLEVDNRRLKLQLAEAEGTVENLAMTLGKKEGELAGFQDQLRKAMDALRSSDDAVEALHNQLKVERAEFDKKLKEEAMKNMTNPNKHSGVYSESEQLSDSEKMALRHSKEVSALAKELEVIKAKLCEKDFKIQTLENSKTRHESYQTVHYFSEKTIKADELPLELLTDLKSLLQQLQREMSSLSKLHNVLSQLHNSGDTASSAELLLTEISSVQKLYRQLEGGVEKNSQLHQALLNSLRGNRRQSDSPDSNSCQDGGYNLGPSDHQEETIPTQQESHLLATSPVKSLGSNTNLAQVDRSFQTGTALSHLDQGVQTSPGPADTVDVGTSATTDSHTNKSSRVKAAPFGNQTNQNKSQSNSLLISPGKYPHLVPSHRLRHSHVHFADTGDNLDNKSVTGDAKGVNPCTAERLQSLDLFDCSAGVLLDEVNFDVRAHDRASSTRFNSRSTNSLSHTISDSAALPPSNSANSPISPAIKNASTAIITTPRRNEFTDNNASLVSNGHDSDDDLDQKGSGHKIGDFIDFNNHRSSSFVSLGTKLDQVNGNRQIHHSKSFNNDQGAEDICETVDRVSANRPGEKVDQRSRRNSWAEELEQYKVHDQDRGVDLQPPSNQSQQEKQVIVSMTTAELRDLVAQLQVDLVDAIKENKALREELKAVPKKQANANTKGALKSKIPRLYANNSCYSTTSEEPDQVDTGLISAHSSHRKIMDSHTLIKNLQDKLHATENTVRLLSKKNKVYVSALESAGISPLVLNRSNSESCLSSYADLSQERSAITAGLSNTDQSRRLAYLLSPLKNRREAARAASASIPAIDAKLLQHSPLAALAISPSTSTSCSPVRHTDTSASSSTSCLQQTQSTAIGATQSMNIADISEPGVYFKVPPVPTSSSFKSTTFGSSPFKESGVILDKSQQPDVKSSLNKNNVVDPTINKSSTFFSPNDDQSVNYNHVNASLIDISAHPDMTYTSFLDGSLLNRPHQMTNMDHTISTTINVDVSVDQLQGRLEHLERVNLTLREEINIYEAICHSQGTQVSPSISDTAGNEQNRPKSDEDLLQQHLVEIKKLRQRLERLDITKDPEQLLIFQTHTQQRITRQETMLAHLQQQLVEKEERHLQECAQLQHRLAREKVVVGEQLEQTIANLRRQLETQASNIAEKEEQVQELKLQLTQAGDREKQQEEEITKIMTEKAELGDDLVKRDKEFLEMEKMMFRLEMAKETSESACRQMEIDLEEKEKECRSLKIEIQESKENSKCLKEIVVKREKALQEKIYNLQKVTSEKISLEQYIREKENHLTKVKETLADLRKEMHDIHATHDDVKSQLLSEIQDLKSDLRKREDLEARHTFQRASYEAEVQRLTEEKIQMKAAHEKELDDYRMETRRQVEDLRKQLQDKEQLESELEMLRERVKIISELQSKVEKLESHLDHKASRELELQDQIDSLVGFQERFDRNQESLKSLQLEKNKILQDLKEREEKLRKRDKQLKNLISQHVKLETTFSKQKNLLKEKTELIYSQKKQLRLFEVSLTASSQEEKNDIMKQLLKELIATQRQVEELLSRLEQNPLSQPTVVVETFGVGKATTSGAGMTTTVTTTSGTGSSCSSGQDNVETLVSVGVREGSPELCLGSLSPSASEADLDVPTSSIVNSHAMATSSSVISPLQPVSTNHSSLAPLHYPLSPTHLRYYADVDSELTPAKIPQSMVGSDIRSLFAVLKLESHEKLCKMSNESLVVLSTIEARLEDRLRIFKAMALSESVDYSTIRETSMSCRNLRLCVEEVVKLAALAWITELPPVDARGHFYDPVLAEQNEKLKRDLTLLRSRHDVLDHTVKEQQGRLQASKERHKNWEQSLYKQLNKTAQDMEKAKENFDAAGCVPKRNLSLRERSPNKPSHNRVDDTV